MQSTAGSKEIAAIRTSSASGIPLVTVLGLYLARPVKVELYESRRPKKLRNIGDSAPGTRPTTAVGVLATGKTISEAILPWRSADEPSWGFHCRCSSGSADCDRNSGH